MIKLRGVDDSNGDGWRSYYGLLSRNVYLSGSCREGPDPGGPNALGIGGA